MTFSIIIIGFNQKDIIYNAIQSALDQTYYEVEVIYVDDASTDGSAEYIESFFRDKRLRIVRSIENRGSSVARLLGIKAASGDWCLLVDGDDTLCLNACEVLAKTIAEQEEDIDIIGFGANLICSEFVPADTKKWMENMVCEPLLGVHTSEELLKIQYGKREKAWVLWNKCFKRNVLQAAEAAAAYEAFYRLTDYYLCFLACSEGKQYFGICDRLYNYNYGPGISQRAIDLKGFTNYMSAFKATPLIKQYASEKGILKEYEACFDAVEREAVIACLVRLVQMEESDQIDASQAFIDTFSPQGVIYAFSAERELMQQHIKQMQQHIKQMQQDINMLEQRNRDLRNSFSFRLGRTITWIPRKVRGGVHCYRDHGTGYILRRALYHMGLRKDEEEI